MLLFNSLFPTKESLCLFFHVSFNIQNGSPCSSQCDIYKEKSSDTHLNFLCKLKHPLHLLLEFRFHFKQFDITVKVPPNSQKNMYTRTIFPTPVHVFGAHVNTKTLLPEPSVVSVQHRFLIILLFL